MNAKLKKSASPWVDPDDAPEVTPQWVAEADLYAGEKLIRRGRPVGSLKATPKISTTIRFDADVLAALPPGSKPSDHPLIVARVFDLHLKELLAELRSGTALGVAVYIQHVVEFQLSTALNLNVVLHRDFFLNCGAFAHA